MKSATGTSWVRECNATASSSTLTIQFFMFADVSHVKKNYGAIKEKSWWSCVE